MTTRSLPSVAAALAFALVGGLALSACGDGADAGATVDLDTIAERDAFDQYSYAVGFETARGIKDDSATFAFFDRDLFLKGYREGIAGDSAALSYMAGYEAGNRLQRDTTFNLNADVFLAAFLEGLERDSSRLSDEALQAIASAVQDSVGMRQLRAAARTDTSAARMLADMTANAQAAAAFLAEVEAREGVQKTDSGLLYEVETEGSGAGAGPDDLVMVEYVGTLADGTQFDRSPPGQAVPIPVGGVVPGFREALLDMKPGGTRTIYLSPQLGYGPQGRPPNIGPNQALVFELTFVEVADGSAMPGVPGQPAQ